VLAVRRGGVAAAILWLVGCWSMRRSMSMRMRRSRAMGLWGVHLLRPVLEGEAIWGRCVMAAVKRAS
jgi:hypothetical protein